MNDLFIAVSLIAGLATICSISFGAIWKIIVKSEQSMKERLDVIEKDNIAKHELIFANQEAPSGYTNIWNGSFKNGTLK
jgi:hypothetical protein